MPNRRKLIKNVDGTLSRPLQLSYLIQKIIEEANDYVTASTIAAKLSLSKNYITQLCGEMKGMGILVSSHKGYTLADIDDNDNEVDVNELCQKPEDYLFLAYVDSRKVEDSIRFLAAPHPAPKTKYYQVKVLKFYQDKGNND